MPVLPSDDTTLDPLELQDQEELQEEEEVVPPVEDVVVPAEIEHELEVEIKEMLVTEEPVPAKRTQMIPQDLIDRKLTPDDWIDEGSI